MGAHQIAVEVTSTGSKLRNASLYSNPGSINEIEPGLNRCESDMSNVSIGLPIHVVGEHSNDSCSSSATMPGHTQVGPSGANAHNAHKRLILAVNSDMVELVQVRS
eukprot:8044306-Pyramimonas_sp.AAC.2